MVATAASWVVLAVGGGVCEPAWTEEVGWVVCVDAEQVVGDEVEVPRSKECFVGGGDCGTSRSSSGGMLNGTGDGGGEQYPESSSVVGGGEAGLVVSAAAGQVSEHSSILFDCSRDQHGGDASTAAIRVRSGGGNSNSGFEGESEFIVHWSSIFVRFGSCDIFQEVGGPVAVSSTALRSSGGIGDFGGPKMPGLQPQRQFRGWPDPPVCLAGLRASEETFHRCRLPGELPSICWLAAVEIRSFLFFGLRGPGIFAGQWSSVFGLRSSFFGLLFFTSSCGLS